MKHHIKGKSEAPQNMHFLRDHRFVLVSPIIFLYLHFLLMNMKENGSEYIL